VSARSDDLVGPGGVYRIRADGGGTRELMLRSQGSPEDLQAPAFLVAGVGTLSIAPGDERVVMEMTAQDDGAPRLMTFRPGVDSVAAPLLPAGERGRGPALSPDGRWLAYWSEVAGVPEVIVRPFPQVAAGRWQVSTGGGRIPAWSPRGNELYYATPNGQFVVASVTTSPSFSVTRRERLYPIGRILSDYALAPDGRRALRFWQLNNRAEAGERVILRQNLAAELRANTGRR